MTDLISRQDAIDIVEFECGEWIGLARTIIKSLENIPQEETERKRGKWIPHEDEYGEHDGDDCSECGERYVMAFGKLNYCPSCGADMREAE